jgi:hypothetical protein
MSEIVFQGYVFPVCTGSDMFACSPEACRPYTLLQTVRTDVVFLIARENVVIGRMRIFMILFSPNIRGVEAAFKL